MFIIQHFHTQYDGMICEFPFSFRSIQMNDMEIK